MCIVSFALGVSPGSILNKPINYRSTVHEQPGKHVFHRSQLARLSVSSRPHVVRELCTLVVSDSSRLPRARLVVNGLLTTCSCTQ